MKIGIVCPYNVFLPGGVQTQVFSQAAELRRRGHEVVIVTPRPQSYTGEAPEGTAFLGYSARIRAQQTAADITAPIDSDQIDELLGAHHFDLVHVHEPLIPFLALQLMGRLDCPKIGTFHAAVPDTILAKSIAGSIGPYKRSVFKYLDAVTAVSAAATSFLHDEVDPRSVAIIPNGIDLASLGAPQKHDRDQNLIVYLGRLEKRKGVRYLLDAFGELQSRRPSVRLIVAGDGPERDSLESRARSRKLRHVQFLGRVSEEVKLDLLSRCGIYSSPAPYGESFGVVLLEAMAAGAVTVAGHNPGYESVLTGTGRLSLVDPKEREEYARRLELLLEDETLARVWRDWAASELPKYSFESVVDQYEQLYRQLVPAYR